MAPKTRGATFEAINVGKDATREQVALVQKLNPAFPNWKDALGALSQDPPAPEVRRGGEGQEVENERVVRDDGARIR